jgi:hypothetical protein
MIKSTLLGSALAIALSASSAMAIDFQALAGLQGTPPAPLPDEVLAAKEGGAACDSVVIAGFGGVCRGVDLHFLTSGTAPVAFANLLPVSGHLVEY